MIGESEDGAERENSDSEDEGNGEEEQKTKPSFAIIPNNTTPVPLGWPKVWKDKYRKCRNFQRVNISIISCMLYGRTNSKITVLDLIHSPSK